LSNIQNIIPSSYKQLTCNAGSVVISNKHIQKLIRVRKKSGIMQCAAMIPQTTPISTIPVSEFEGKKALNNLILGGIQ
jgi:hypothetical protein